MFNLTWADGDLANRRISVRKSKTGKPRLIVMTIGSALQLSRLRAHLEHDAAKGKQQYVATGLLYPREKVVTYQFQAIDRLFPMNVHAFEQVWDDVRKRAGLLDPDPNRRLTFHSLRHEAASRFRRILTVYEAARMLGHSDRTMTDRYSQLDDNDLRSIQDKLDRYTYWDSQKDEQDPFPLPPDEEANFRQWIKTDPHLCWQDWARYSGRYHSDDDMPSPVTGMTPEQEHYHEKREKTIAQFAAAINTIRSLEKVIFGVLIAANSLALHCSIMDLT
jgi:hypothetical protein